ATAEGLRLGTWLQGKRQKYRRGQLAPRRVSQLVELGVDWNPIDTAWRAGLARLADYHRDHGTACVPQRHITTDGYKLGSWVNTQRRNYRAGKLSDDQIAALTKLGMNWNPHQQLWDKAIAALTAYKQERGTADVPQKYITADGFHLGNWLHTRRRQYRNGTLAPERATQLEALGVTFTRRQC
ncbi:helicase, partial [Nocardia terpenica]|uniref:helicase associated domain-containing protein n=1 Tax=Nocardia terpenica TaxID=455432 RepID=UPI002FE19166